MSKSKNPFWICTDAEELVLELNLEELRCEQMHVSGHIYYYATRRDGARAGCSFSPEEQKGIRRELFCHEVFERLHKQFKKYDEALKKEAVSE